MTRPFFKAIVPALILFLGLTSASHADNKQQALDWLDEFAKDQVLFEAEDLQRLRSELASATSAEIDEWLERTRESRDWLTSPEWQSTHHWFREFLRVQAMFSEEEIAMFRKRAFEAFQSSSEQFNAVLGEVQAQRSALARGSAISARVRESRLDAYRSYRMELERARNSVNFTAQVPSAPYQRQAARSRTYRTAPPLISSLTVARWSIWR